MTNKNDCKSASDLVLASVRPAGNRESSRWRAKPLRIVLGMLMLLSFVGCGESQEDMFMRAARRPRPKDDEPAAVIPPAPAVAEVTPDAPATDEKAANSNPSATDESLAASDPTSSDAQEVPASQPDPVTGYLPPSELLRFDSQGRFLVYTGEANAIGVYDVATKELVSTPRNRHLSPSSLAIDETRSHLAVGSADGTYKLFSLESDQGLDKFAAGQLRARQALPPVKAHSHPVSAVAVSIAGGKVATGDASGELRLWSSSEALPKRYSGGDGGFVSLRSYQDDQLVFGTTKSGKVIFWRAKEPQGVSATEFAAIENTPSVVAAGPNAKGMAVGEKSGRVTTWLSDGTGLSKQSFQAHDSEVAGLSFSHDGSQLITASRSGEIVDWKLPIESSQRIELTQPTSLIAVARQSERVVVSNADRGLDLYNTNSGSLIRAYSLASGHSVTAADFSQKDASVIAGDDRGFASLFANQDRPEARLMLSDSAIDVLHCDPDSSAFAFAASSGTVGIASAPRPSIRFSRPEKINIAQADAAGARLLAIVAGQAVVLDAVDGSVISEVSLGDVEISAAALEGTFALLASADGDLWIWKYPASGAVLESIATSVHTHPILAVGITSTSEVWSCDASGKRVISPIGASTPQSKSTRTHKAGFNQPLKALSVSPRGSIAALDAKGGLLVADSLDIALAAVKSLDTETLESVVSKGASAVGLSSSKSGVIRVPADADNSAYRLSAAPELGEITRYPATDSMLTLLTEKGHFLATSWARNDQRSSALLPSGTMEAVKFSKDGASLVAQTVDGQCYHAVTEGPAKKLDGIKGNLLALAPDGSTAILSEGESGRFVRMSAEGGIAGTSAIPQAIRQPTSACFFADGEGAIIAGSDGQLFRVSMAKPDPPEPVVKVDGSVSDVLLNAAQDQLLVRTEAGQVFFVSVGKTPVVVHDSQVEGIAAAAPFGDNFIAGDRNGRVLQLQAGREPEVVIPGGGAAIQSVSGDPSQELVVATTQNGEQHFIHPSIQAWVSTRLKEKASPTIGSHLASGRAIFIDETCTLTSIATPSLFRMAGPESNIQHASITDDETWLVAANQAGQMVRWPIESNKIGKALRSNVKTMMDHLLPIPDSDLLLALQADHGLATYRPSEDKLIVHSAAGDPKVLVGIGFDRTLIFEQKGRFHRLDLQSGSITAVDPSKLGLGTAQGAFGVGKNRPSDWLVLQPDGSYATGSWADSTGPREEFKAGSQIGVARLRSGRLMLQHAGKLEVLGSDGVQIREFSAPSGKVTCAAIANKSAAIAACDGSATLWLPTESDPRRSVALPDRKEPRSVLWSADDTQVALAFEQEILIIDAERLRVLGAITLSNGTNELVSFKDSHIWCKGTDGRLFSVAAPRLNWTANLPEPAVVAAWQSEGKEIVFGLQSGMIYAFDAETGTEVATAKLDASELRSAVALPADNGIVFLAGDAEFYRYGTDRSLQKLTESSGVRLKDLSSDGLGGRLFGCNEAGEVLAWDLSAPQLIPKTVPCEIKCAEVRPLGPNRLIGRSDKEPALSVVSSSVTKNVLSRAQGSIADFAVLPDHSFAVVADGSSVVQLIGIRGEGKHDLNGGTTGFRAVDVHPRGLHVAAAGGAIGDGESRLMIWDALKREVEGEANLPSVPIQVLYSPDGGLLAVAMEDGSCQVHDGKTARLLEGLPATPGLNTVAFSSDNRSLFLGQEDGTMLSQPLTSLGAADVGESPITSLNFHNAGKYLICGEQTGRLSFWSTQSLDAPNVIFKGLTARLILTKVGVDGRSLLAVYDDPERSVLVWNFDAPTGVPTALSPQLVIRSPARNTSANFTSDGRFVILGGEDGVLRAWSRAEGREVARFNGHKGSVLDVAPLTEPGRFVSAGADHGIRTWRFPSNLPGAADPIPEGALADATAMQHVSVPTDSPVVEIDPQALARESLLAGVESANQIETVFSHLGGSTEAIQDAKQSALKLIAMEGNPDASLEDIYRERKRLTDLRRKLGTVGRSENSMLYSDGFSNKTFTAPTKFRFDQDKSRPVILRFSDRYLYAARPSGPKRAVREGEPMPDEGDNGALLSWEYQISQLAARAWDIEELKVREIFSLPNSAGVCTAPDIMVFNQGDGSSRRLSTATGWDWFSTNQSARNLFAVGSSGAIGVETDILKIFDAANLGDEKVVPLSQYTSFEGVVTSMAFAHTRPVIAFCVRVRSVHRLFIADAENLSLTLVSEKSHKRPLLSADPDGESGGGDPGITSLAFSLDDQLLAAHGRHEGQFEFSTWDIRWQEDGSFTHRSVMATKQEAPFLTETNSRPIRFVDSSVTPAVKGKAPVSNRTILIENSTGFARVDLSNRRSKPLVIPYLPMQRGLPQRFVTEDANWIIMGDDKGMVYVWEVLTGEKRSIALGDQATASGTAGLSGPPEARPAHSGPVVGVALSQRNSRGHFPSFAATIGEENQVKVWDLSPIWGQSDSRSTAVSKIPPK